MPNGLGPYWFPDLWRDALTRVSSRYFDEAAWGKHDDGYERKRPSRLVCDVKFYLAMRRDSQKQRGIRRISCHAVSIGFFLTVRVFGVISWHYPKPHKDTAMTPQEIQELADKTQAHIAAAIKGMTKLQHIACACSVSDTSAHASAGLTAHALGHLWQAHGDATAAASQMPDVTPKFGDK